MLHRVILGSLERFMGALLEHYAGALPLWLSPNQVTIIPISAGLEEYAVLIKQKLEDKDIRVSLDSSSETLNKRIRQAEVEKTPYILVVGEREAKQNAVAVRKRSKGDIGAMPWEDFIKLIKKEIEDKL